MSRRLGLALVPMLLAVSVVAGCGGNAYDGYCKTVESQRTRLSDAVASGTTDALVATLPALRALASAAPSDVKPKYAVVIDAIDGFGAAVKGKDQAAIKAAAAVLASTTVSSALSDIEQEVRDVCHTPLTL